MSQGFETEAVKAKKGVRQPQKSTAAADITEIQQSLVKHFGDIKDRRVERTKKHQLTDILVIAILALIALFHHSGESII